MAARSLLRDRNVRLVAGSVAVSAAGDWIALVALAIHIEHTTGSGAAISALFICLWAPVVVLAGHAGLLVDRVETTRLLVLVSLAQAGVAVALAFVDSLAVVLLLAVLLGVGFALTQAAEFALVPVVARERVQEANGLVETARYAGFTFGPICGSVLMAASGTVAALLVNAASFAAVAVAAAALTVRRPPAVLAAGAPKPRARDGLVVLFADRALALSMGVIFVSLLFMSASIPADVVYVEHVLGVENLGLGVVLTVWTIGMIVGAVVLAKRVPIAAVAAVAFAAIAVQGLGKFLTPFWLVFGFMVGCYLVAGMAHGLKNVMLRTLIHTSVPAEAHGRAAAAFNGFRNGAELGALALGGVLVGTIGARGTLWLAGGVAALAGLVGLVLLARLRARTADDAAAPAPVGLAAPSD
jgi:predicted MFS family arabinose efflux permease